MPDLVSTQLWALLPFLFGILCFIGAVVGVRNGRAKRTLILTLGGVALVVAAWAMWNGLSQRLSSTAAEPVPVQENVAP